VLAKISSGTAPAQYCLATISVPAWLKVTVLLTGKFLEDLFLARDIDVAVMYDLGDFTGRIHPSRLAAIDFFGAGWVIVLIGIALRRPSSSTLDLNSSNRRRVL